MKRVNSIISIIVIVLIMITTLAPVMAMESDSKTIYITNADDLYQLSKNSSLDSWSQDKTIILKNDIDLKGESFPPIPIFSGTFDGQGHTIRGLSISVEGSNQGLFRYLEEDGIIKNLSVEGVVTPEGERSNIGGIVGNNKGVLENCSFSGLVRGKDTVGGLVGWNSTSGMVINSSFHGIIYGEGKVGGVIGYNAGTILRCLNEGDVNTTVEEHKLDFEDITMDNINLTRLFSDATDIGGITGVNTGIVQSSENQGTVGYPHVGYNVGGIVGRQSGHITKSINYGNIYGRKEVAGIAGHMEPHISKIMEPSKLRHLQRELNNLQSSITRIIDNTRIASDLTVQDLLFIQDNINNSKDHTQSLIDQTEALINEDIEEINKISIIAVEALDKLIPITEAFTDTIEVLDESISPIQGAIKYLSKSMDGVSRFGDRFWELSNTLDYSIVRINRSKERVKESYRDVAKAMKILQEGKTDGVLELFKSAGEHLKAARGNLRRAVHNLKYVGDDIMDMMSSIGYLGRYMGDSLDYVLDATGIMEDATDGIIGIFEGINDLLEFLGEQDSLEFATADDLYQETREDLFDSIDDISASFSQFTQNINTQGNIILEDMQSINDQLFLVMNLMLDIVEEISSGDGVIGDIIKDVSRENIEKKTEGNVSDSKNFGTIEADLNVGGIAGAMSIKLTFDPEEDFDLGSRLSTNTIFETQAIISGCENEGNIIGKKNNVGGIVGKMDLGYIENCMVDSSVESTDGNYVGGIAGYGKEITNSYTLVEVGRARACVGAISGDIDKNAIIKENYFVSDILNGIDGISYMDKAEPIDYEKLIAIEGIPSMFKEFQLSFWIDDKLIDTMDFHYGHNISEIDFPDIPSKEGYYIKWEDLDMESLTFDTKIHGEYIPYLTILESKEKRDEVLSIVLVEGKFTDEDALTLIQGDELNASELDDSTLLEQWIVLIPQDGKTTHNIRYLPPESKGKLEVYTLIDEKWTKIKSQRDGKYLVFEVDGDSVTFGVMESQTSYEIYKILGIMGVSMIIIFLRLFRKKQKSPI